MTYVQLLQIPLGATAKLPSELLASFRGAEGNLVALWAPQHEDATLSGIAASWESLDKYKEWAASGKGLTAKKQISELATGPVYEDFVLFIEDVTPTLNAKVVELVSWIHPTSKIDDEKKKKVEYGFSQFQKAISTQAPQSDGGLVAGWGEMEFDHDGVPSRRFTSLIGWKSVQAHYNFHSTVHREHPLAE